MSKLSGDHYLSTNHERLVSAEVLVTGHECMFDLSYGSPTVLASINGNGCQLLDSVPRLAMPNGLVDERAKMYWCVRRNTQELSYTWSWIRKVV